MKRTSGGLAGSRPSADAAQRGRLHLACAVAGLIGTAAWSAYALGSFGAHANSSRWWSLTSLMGFGIAAVLGRALHQQERPRPALDYSCTVLVAALVVGWIRSVGPSGAWLDPILPLLVLAHWLSGGWTFGALALAVATIPAVCIAIEGRVEAFLHGGAASGSYPFDAMPGILACFVAAWLGHELATPGQRRHGTNRSLVRTSGRFSIGSIVDDKYRLERRIGQGGMGRVYEALRISDGRRVALKVLHPHLAEHAESVVRFRREVAVTSRLPERRVASIFDVGSAGRGIEYIAMELLDGEDLAARLRRVRRLSSEDTVRMVEQLAEVLEAAAKCGVVHRDVKPRNVFLTNRPHGELEARLLDFGICRLQDHRENAAKLTRSGKILGTPGFLAPEQISSRFGEIGPHTDVFALGCVVYQCLTGQRPFPARDPAGAVYEVLNHHPRPIHECAPDVPPAVDWVLAVALAKQSSDRYASAAEFAKDLRAAVNRTADPELAERGQALLGSVGVSSTVTR